jgi:hypothetical protein
MRRPQSWQEHGASVPPDALVRPTECGTSSRCSVSRIRLAPTSKSLKQSVLMAEAVPSSATDEVKIEKRTRLTNFGGCASKVGTWRVRF